MLYLPQPTRVDCGAENLAPAAPLPPTDGTLDTFAKQDPEIAGMYGDVVSQRQHVAECLERHNAAADAWLPAVPERAELKWWER